MTFKKKLLFLGCNYLQIPYLKEAKKMGYFVVGTDINKSPPGKKYLDKFYNVGYEDLEGLLQIGKKESFTGSDKVFTAASQFAHLGAAYFARQFKSGYIPLETVNICLDKVKFYRFLTDQKVPPPKYYVCRTQKEIEKIIKGSDKNYFLKSDFGKNPFYVYHIKNGKVARINFKKDRYLRESYVLQEEIIGRHLRLNFFDEDFIYFIHERGLLFSCRDKIGKFQSDIEDTAFRMVKRLKLQKRFVKFDLILSKDNYYMIDIGIDPPARFRVLSKYLGNNFAKNFFLHNMGFMHEYPSIKEMVNAKVLVSGRGVRRLRQ